jgi:DNA-binding winged helix-turn-helix (wHTH) protein
MTDALWLDTINGDVFINDKRLFPKLSKRLFTILEFLYKKSQTENPIASFEEISAVGWAGEIGVSFEMVDVGINRLRTRLKELEDEHLFIETIKGRGRKFVQKTI